MMPSITVVPFGGLGNRLRVLRSALELSDKPLKLFWFKKAELYAHFYELFSCEEFNIVEEKGISYSLYKLLMKHIYTVKYPRLYKIILGSFYDCVILDEDVISLNAMQLKDKINGSQRVLIATCYQFQDFENYNVFKPEASIQKTADKLQSTHKPWQSITGVHIRRTDHKDIKSLGGVEVYKNQIDILLQEEPQRKLLICSDDESVKTGLKSDYPNNAIVRSSDLSRSSETGMADALVDIILLSRCDNLIGSARSSFVTLAQQFGNKKELIDIENV